MPEKQILINSTQTAVLALAEAHHLKRMDDPAAHKKFLPQVYRNADGKFTAQIFGVTGPR